MNIFRIQSNNYLFILNYKNNQYNHLYLRIVCLHIEWHFAHVTTSILNHSPWVYKLFIYVYWTRDRIKKNIYYVYKYMYIHMQYKIARTWHSRMLETYWTVSVLGKYKILQGACVVHYPPLRTTCVLCPHLDTTVST